METQNLGWSTQHLGSKRQSASWNHKIEVEKINFGWETQNWSWQHNISVVFTFFSREGFLEALNPSIFTKWNPNFNRGTVLKTSNLALSTTVPDFKFAFDLVNLNAIEIELLFLVKNYVCGFFFFCRFFVVFGLVFVFFLRFWQNCFIFTKLNANSNQPMSLKTSTLTLFTTVPRLKFAFDLVNLSEIEIELLFFGKKIRFLFVCLFGFFFYSFLA